MKKSLLCSDLVEIAQIEYFMKGHIIIVTCHWSGYCSVKAPQSVP